MEKMRLPKGVQVFRKLREEGYYYADKTAYISLLMQEENPNIFLSRPRRFGKSLFVSTLKEAFGGSKELFEGLALYDKWDWSTVYPVVHLDFSAGDYFNVEELDATINRALRAIARRAGFTLEESTPTNRLLELIDNFHYETGQKVVLLVDEYDKPILDMIGTPDIATANRDRLRSLYGVTKTAAEQIHFSFFTGVSRFSKTSLFSGANNFEDVTINPAYSAICGYSESDLNDVFAQELEGLSREEIRKWYNGYSWLGKERVYNPYDILYLLDNREFDYWWFRTGLPKFLVDVLSKRNVMSIDLGRMRPRGDLLESFDIDKVEPEALLFQAGYLTIAKKTGEGSNAQYQLDYPNREVRERLNQLLLEMMLPGASQGLLDDRDSLLEHLLKCDVEGMNVLFQKVLAGIPRQLHAPIDLTQYEAYFASLFYSYFAGVGLKVLAEDPTNRGRVDLVLEGPSYTYIFELKMVDDDETGEAMKQILDREYPQKYRGSGNVLYLAGMEISKKTHNIVGFKVKKDGDDDQ